MEKAREAAREGNIDELYRLIEENPELLGYFDNSKFIHTPLHEAAKTGQTQFAIEVMNLKPSFARKLNPQGLSPLDLAVMEDHTDETATGEGESKEREKKNETAKALIKLDSGLIRVKGKHMMTPMHHAVMENNVDLLVEFLCASPGSIDDVTNRFQTAVHLAVENKKPQIFSLLLGWLKRRKREDVIRWEDKDGNNVLHIAVQTEQEEMVRKLVHKIHRTSRNLKELTPLDIAHQKRNNDIKHLLIGNGARDNDYNLPRDIMLPKYLESKESFLERILSFYFHMGREMSLELRNVILVVATLIVTAAFQGILSPPGGLWQGSADTTAVNMYNFQRRRRHQKHEVGKTVAKTSMFIFFLLANSAAFVCACAIIVAVIPGRPISIGLFFSLIFLSYSYAAAVEMISESSIFTTLICSVTFLFSFASCLLRIYLFHLESIFYDSWWVPVPVSSVVVVNCLYQRPTYWLTKFFLGSRARLKLQHKVCGFGPENRARAS